MNRPDGENVATCVPCAFCDDSDCCHRPRRPIRMHTTPRRPPTRPQGRAERIGRQIDRPRGVEAAEDCLRRSADARTDGQPTAGRHPSGIMPLSERHHTETDVRQSRTPSKNIFASHPKNPRPKPVAGRGGFRAYFRAYLGVVCRCVLLFNFWKMKNAFDP